MKWGGLEESLRKELLRRTDEVLQEMEGSMNSPWGPTDWTRVLGDGIVAVGTASHGGIHVSPELNERIPERLRNFHGWYEEDCAWAIVAVQFPELFDEKRGRYARTVVEEYWPIPSFKVWIEESFDRTDLIDALQYEFFDDLLAEAMRQKMYDRFHEELWEVLSDLAEDKGTTPMALLASASVFSHQGLMWAVLSIVAREYAEAILEEAISE